MFEFAGVLLNPFEVAYCQIVQQLNSPPGLVVALTSGDSFMEQFDSMEELRDVVDELSSFIDPMVDYDQDNYPD